MHFLSVSLIFYIQVLSQRKDLSKGQCLKSTIKGSCAKENIDNAFVFKINFLLWFWLNSHCVNYMAKLEIAFLESLYM